MSPPPDLLAILSTPRPNGSRAERETCHALLDWLARHSIPAATHTFRIYPFIFELLGIWIILTRTLLAISIWQRWGWASLAIAFLTLPGGLVDIAWGFPLVSWIGARNAQNIIVTLGAKNPQQEMVLSAHYDSKTELLDHRKRMFFLKNIRTGILITLVLGSLGALDGVLLATGSNWAGLVYLTGCLLTLPLLFLAWGLGLNLATGRLLPPSQGAVDNGAACAILLRLAEKLAAGEIPLEHTQVTIALFTGEEVNMQGSGAYVGSRSFPLPTAAVNLEVMAQDGEYVYWEQDGNVLRLLPTSSSLNRLVCDAVEKITASAAQPAGPVNSDGGPFVFAGIPTCVLGTYDRVLRDTGFHTPADNPARVVPERIAQGVDILQAVLMAFDQPGRGLPPFTHSLAHHLTEGNHECPST